MELRSQRSGNALGSWKPAQNAGSHIPTATAAASVRFTKDAKPAKIAGFVRFLCRTPFPRGFVESFEPELREITDDPELARQHKQWAMRRYFHLNRTVLSAFDHVYVINLDADRIRLDKIATRLSELNISFERFSAIAVQGEQCRFLDPRIKPGAYACAQSHAALLRLILERNRETALILEDDAVFRDDMFPLLHQITTELGDQEWDVFYLGLHLVRAAGRVSQHVGRVGLGFHSHAYAVSLSAIPRLLACIERMLTNPISTFDCYNDSTLVKLYGIPILAIQEPNRSYTFGRVIDRLPQYFLPFDGDDFERHCDEVKTWNSEWREYVSLLRACAAAERALQTQALEEVIARHRHMLSMWPTFIRELRCDPQFQDAAAKVDCSGTPPSEQVWACGYILRTIKDALSNRF